MKNILSEQGITLYYKIWSSYENSDIVLKKNTNDIFMFYMYLTEF